MTGSPAPTRSSVRAAWTSSRGYGPRLSPSSTPSTGSARSWTSATAQTTITAHLIELGLDAACVHLPPRMVEHARRLYPDLRFAVASATELDLAPASLGGVLGCWSLFSLREDLAGVLKTFVETLVPGWQALVGTHVGDGDVPQAKGYGGPPVPWTTRLYHPQEVAGMPADAGLELIADLRFPPLPGQPRAQVLLAARRSALPKAGVPVVWLERSVSWPRRRPRDRPVLAAPCLCGVGPDQVGYAEMPG